MEQWDLVVSLINFLYKQAYFPTWISDCQYKPKGINTKKAKGKLNLKKKKKNMLKKYRLG